MNSTENAFFLLRQIAFSKGRITKQLEILSDPQRLESRKNSAKLSLQTWKELHKFWSRQLTPPATYIPKKQRKAMRKTRIQDRAWLKELQTWM